MKAALAPAALLALIVPAVTGAQRADGDQRQQLVRANQASRVARIRAEELERQAAAAKGEAARAGREQAAVAARAEAAEADIAAARARIALVDRALTVQRRRLDAQRAPTMRLVAALQSFARRPASLALLQPGSARDAVHVRALLASVVPAVRARSAAVRAEIARTRRLREGARLAAASLRDGRVRLEQERLRLVQLESESRLRSRELTRGALVESDRAIALGEEARDIVDQMAVADAAGETRARLLTLGEPLPRPDDPAGARTARAPAYRLPAAGRIVAGLGEVSESGVRSRGLTLSVAPGAIVTAPAAGRIVFARRFGGYGTVVIIDHGEGWTSLISGLAEAQVARGAAVGQGMPIGRAGNDAEPRITTELRRRGMPFDLVGLMR
ncbi:murein hydrolase activator EnvC family protein [Sphingomonas sp. Y38-1Y]|uniref:murein hydrolase activator EnvC family protein n=1 Tax=Sphingomonas sp. Y38-1Y TaxID=3078265 RepID=UPI0028EF127F|nr:peptidoglycan DD-metalloendopeptidase family protein [Sphingomonas sp. Y38-1Y]